MFLWRTVQSTKPDVRCVFLHISKRHVSFHPTSSRGHHSLKLYDNPSCVTNVITDWRAGGVAVALEPSVFPLQHAQLWYAQLYACDSERTRNSCGCLRVSTALFVAQCAGETRGFHFVWTGIGFVHIRRTNESNCWNDRCGPGTWGLFSGR
jgi:hypothetical protein